MKKKLNYPERVASFFAAILLILTLIACHLNQESAEAAPALLQPKTSLHKESKAETRSAKGKLFLWKMTAESGATLFLLGTIHVFKPEYYPLPAEMEKAFSKSKALIVEVNTTKSSPDQVKSLLSQRGSYQAPDNLAKHVSPETINALGNYCQKTGLPLPVFLSMKPWLASIQVMQLEIQKLGYNSKYGIDLHFMNEANKISKKIIGLETEEFQLSMFADLPQDLQKMMLDLTFIDMHLIKEDAGKMMDCWFAGDAKGLDQVMNRDVIEHPEFMPVTERVLYQRNITMAEKLEPYLKGAPDDVYLVAVGSGHLVGDRSIIELLKKKGYKAEQLKVGDQI